VQRLLRVYDAVFQSFIERKLQAMVSKMAATHGVNVLRITEDDDKLTF